MQRRIFGQSTDAMAQQQKKSSIDKQIDENLKRVFDQTLNEELPEKFLDLISQLKAKESADGGAENGK
ncbi:NepR family anti-sigma factor [[Roseibacterium] beibuensis]|nr:NepR family anti-sigma factor [Roseibacterium beibuensis]